MKRRTEKTTEKGKKMVRKDAVTGLRQILVRRRDALRRALAGDLSSLKELRQQTSSDVVDAALDSAQDEISSQLAEVESRELAHIELALERMRDGNYGACEGCGEGIPMARLQALPYATMCIQCQREAEKNGEDLGGANWNRILDVGLADNEISASDLEIDV
jgi:DnaK suppressor protein